MSKLQDLINELCPHGVEYKALNEIASYSKDRIEIEYVDENNYIGIDNLLKNKQGKVPASSVPSMNRLTKYEKDDVLIGNIRPYLKKIWLADCCGGTNGDVLVFQIKDKNIIIPAFLYCVLSADDFFNFDMQHSKGSKMPRGDKAIIMTYSVPIPPIEVQQEIVNVLDSFSDVKSNFVNELMLELENKRKIYEYSRDKLLSFDYGVEYKALGETIVSLNTGLNPRRFFKLNTDNANNYYVTIRELQNNKIVFSEKTDRINDDALKLCNNRSNLEAGDILFSGTGTIGVTALVEKTPENWNIKEGVYTIKPKQDIINSKFLMYLLNSEDIRKAFLKKAAGGTVKSVPMAELKSVLIPVPPLVEQERIVATLDKLTETYNAVTDGIQKEIEQIEKIYTYCTDKLLTFKEKKQ